MPNTARLATALANQAAAGQEISVQNYKIDHVTTASPPTTDGATAVYLDISGDSTSTTSGTTVQQSAYLDSLTSPLKGQLVRVLLVNGSPLILGRVVGLPA